MEVQGNKVELRLTILVPSPVPVARLLMTPWVNSGT